MTGFMSFPIKNDNCCVVKYWHRMSLMTQLIDIGLKTMTTVMSFNGVERHISCHQRHNTCHGTT